MEPKPILDPALHEEMLAAIRSNRDTEAAIVDRVIEVVNNQMNEWRHRGMGWFHARKRTHHTIIDIVRVDVATFQLCRRYHAQNDDRQYPFQFHPVTNEFLIFGIPLEAGPDGCGIQLLTELPHH